MNSKGELTGKLCYTGHATIVYISFKTRKDKRIGAYQKWIYGSPIFLGKPFLQCLSSFLRCFSFLKIGRKVRKYYLHTSINRKKSVIMGRKIYGKSEQRYKASSIITLSKVIVEISSRTIA